MTDEWTWVCTRCNKPCLVLRSAGRERISHCCNAVVRPLNLVGSALANTPESAQNPDAPNPQNRS